MATTRHCSLFLILLIAGICDAADYNILNLDFVVRRKFESWMAKHSRVYKDAAEKARRLEIFKDNLRFIDDFNRAGNHSYTVGLTQFTDLTNEEFSARYASEFVIPKVDSAEPRRSVKYEDMRLSNVSALSNNVDWRAWGAVGPVINQGQCESCWAMSAAAAMEGLNQIQTGRFVSLSSQQLIDCDRYDNGCHKGLMTNAFQYVIENGGITDAYTYPFTYGAEQRCDSYREKQVVFSISGYRQVPQYNEAALMAAVANQPVSVAVHVLPYPSFQHYTGGIYDGPCGATPDHAVVAVGYGQSNYGNYWIVKNSWGDNWGDSGYIYMRKDVPWAEGMCGITLDASYPTI